jgi:Ca-activated chloride channel family protein
MMADLFWVKALRFFWSGATALLCLSFFVVIGGIAQTPSLSSSQNAGSYSLSVPVNEVEIVFHAVDAQNHPVLDLSAKDMDLFDNGNGPGKIIDMRLLQDRPIQMAIALDTSGSVASAIAESRAAALEVVRKLLVTDADRGAVIAFGRSKHLLQGWTNAKRTLEQGIEQAGTRASDSIDGTSLYDTLFTTCLYEFGEDADGTSTRVIFLFSDGVDTAGSTKMQAAIERCQRSHTAIYAFSPKAASDAASSGPSVLRQITEQTGGRLFAANDSEREMEAAVGIAGADLKSEYLLLYRPAKLAHDGAFHRIVLVGPKRVAAIAGTSGFYDSAR